MQVMLELNAGVPDLSLSLMKVFEVDWNLCENILDELQAILNFPQSGQELAA